MIRFARAFLHFWADFLIGDRLELFVGPILALLIAWLLVGAGLPGAVVGSLLFGAIALIGAVSVGLAARR
ncbi:MAG TPA: hypothetical protein VFC81_03335 [Verrucomicrobiae bacterium]|jgi:hypothetical protein|nr:hypothetical protein [Verrucomicrobiae bacterium]